MLDLARGNSLPWASVAILVGKVPGLKFDLARKRNCQKRTPRPISRAGFLREIVLTPAEAWK